MKIHFNYKPRFINSRRKLACFFLFMNIISTDTIAEVSTASRPISINVSVTVRAATCDISNMQGGDSITVDFETITKKGVENGIYESIVPFKIRCSDDSSSITLKLSGDASHFDTSLLKSIDNENLGFEFQLNNQKMELEHQSFVFAADSIPSLKVIPRLNSKAEKDIAGDFNSATAKIILQYE